LLEALDTYTWGASGTNDCPTKYFRIMSEEACRTAAIAFGKTYGGITPQRSDRPRGCFWNTDAGGFTVFINLDAVGSGYPDRLLLCSGAPFRTDNSRATRACWLFNGVLRNLSATLDLYHAP
jgi:hypothetical protein